MKDSQLNSLEATIFLTGSFLAHEVVSSLVLAVMTVICMICRHACVEAEKSK